MEERLLTRRSLLATLPAGLAGLGYGAPTAGETQPYRPESGGHEQNVDGAGERTARMSEDEDRGSSTSEVSAGDQVRVCTNSENAACSSVLYTVPDDADEELDWVNENVRERLGVDEDAELYVEPYAPHPDYTTKEEAESHDEFVEYLTEHGETSLVATAPHGGRVEYQTNEQAELVAQSLDATEWGCFGYNSGGGAYDRWHITSTEISRHSFPLLDTIADRGFAHAVSFHGFTKDGIAVGGGASRELKERFCEEIEAATDGRYDVYIPNDQSPYAGLSRRNFVNWLTESDNGIQIEQCRDARVDDYEVVAEAVTDIYAELLA